ncbi:MAG TPA: hypothetical protein VK700_01470 [Steroidobacteraceae bacterium]|nr:hypothetical protein [Steroidobacteraceae bacterium]
MILHYALEVVFVALLSVSFSFGGADAFAEHRTGDLNRMTLHVRFGGIRGHGAVIRSGMRCTARGNGQYGEQI